MNKAEKESIGLTVGNRSRIIPIFLSNIPHTDWLEKLRGTSGFPFHDGNDYGDPLKNTSPEFSDQMIQLRNSLVHIFDDFSKELGKSQPTIVIQPKEEEKENGFTIFLAEVNDSLIDRRDGIIAELKEKGYNIIIGDPSISEAEIHEHLTKKAISRSDMAVHLLGRFPGRKISGDTENHYIQKQTKIGFETETPQLIWVSREVDFDAIENKQHQEFLVGVENATLTDKKYEFIRGNEGELAKLIIDYAIQLEEIKSQKESQLENKKGVPIKVLLDTHSDDFKQAFNLKKNFNRLQCGPHL